MAESLETDYPWIPWREPVPVVVYDNVTLEPSTRYSCRFCTAARGLGTERQAPFATPAEVEAHLAQAHPPLLKRRTG
jgi:hypothetical protein